MALTKGVTSVWASQTLTAGAGDTTGMAVDTSNSYDTAISARITNGATGPTIPAQIQIEVSYDNSDWYAYGPALVGGTDNNGVYEWGAIDIPMAVQYVRPVGGSNTDQNVTVDFEVGEVTAV